MKKLFASAVLLVCFMGQTAHAALPPLWQSVREMEAILSSDQLGAHFVSGELLEDIVKVGNAYLVRGSQSAVFVEVINVPQEMAGPVKFKLKWYPISDLIRH